MRKAKRYIALVCASVLASNFMTTPSAKAGSATLNGYGMPGLIDMPSGQSASDAQLSTTISKVGGVWRNTLSFQITRRLSGSFRYAILENCNCFGFPTYYDRSFDVHYQLFFEGRYRPAVAIGLRDFVGTGIYSSEYIAATKQITPSLRLTGGIGWGTLGTYNSFRNPLSAISSRFDTRPGGFLGSGGVPGINQWFRGPAALFAGVEWETPVRGLTFKAEYSSDDKQFEVSRGLLVHNSPLNFALEYQVSRGIRLSGYYMHGSTFGLKVELSQNPRRSLIGGSLENAPVPVFQRPKTSQADLALLEDTEWLKQKDGGNILLQNLQTTLEGEDFIVESLALTGSAAEIRVRNRRYDAGSQAFGRVARMLTRVLPVSIDVFTITMVVDGLPAGSLVVNRQDLERFENDPDGSRKVLEAATFKDPGPMAGQIFVNPNLYPHVTWAIGPYTRYSLFDPENPFRFDVGLRLRGSIEIRPGLSVSGSVIKKAFGNLASITRVSNSVLPHVRSDFGLYDQQGDPALEYLSADFLFKPGRNLYGRMSAGYLERMYAGVSAELLWKPTNSRFALGAEVNYVQQRAFTLGFGLRPYRIATGHVSAYWDFRNGFSAQVDVGRYLAGDWGATFAVDRKFSNGWAVGAFFTLTNVSFSRFGEGSFDKGFRFTVPLSWMVGRPTLKSATPIVRPVTRDGGARLSIRNRLYPQISRYHRHGAEPAWGRFWR